jgi:hypothetical protein
MQNSTQVASGLSTSSPARLQAKVEVVEEVERLRWRIWNGKAKNAQRSIDRIRKVMDAFKRGRYHRTRGASSRKLWSDLHEVDRYLRGQSAGLVRQVTPCWPSSRLRKKRQTRLDGATKGQTRAA